MMAELSKISINFLNAIVSLTKRVIETGLYVKLTDSPQYVQATLCHPFHCSMGL